MSGQEMEWIERVPVHQPAWLFISLFILISLFAWIRIYYGSILNQTIQASVNLQVANRIFLNNSLLQKQLDNMLYLLYLLVAGLFAYVIEWRFHVFPYKLSGIFLYMFNLGLLAGIFFVRILLVNLTGFLFNRIKIFREYLYNTFIFNKLIGIALLPVLIFLFYTKGVLKEVFIWASMVLLAAILIMRMARGLIYSFRKDISIFYLFLYLCALEIAPLMILYRWFEGIL
jgi:hypothetical protein